MGKLKKYEAVKQYIANRIHSGVLAPGDRIPTEVELMEIFEISRNPVRKALSVLCDDGYIDKVHGSGCYVLEQVLTEEININVIMFHNRYLESRIIQGMRRAIDNCSFKNINLILKRPGRSAAEYGEVLENIQYREKCGVLCIPLIDRKPTFNKLLESSFRKLGKSAIPMVQVDQFLPDYRGSFIMTDHKKGAADMIRLIVNKGHRTIAVFHEIFIKPSLELRIEGVVQAAGESPETDVKLVYFPVDSDDVKNKGAKILEKLKEEMVTAIFCLTCELTYELYHFLSGRGVEIPGDYSLCSFDDHSFLGERGGNEITAVIQPFGDIGYYSVNILLDQILGRTSGQVKMLLEPEIVQRRSLGSIAGNEN